MEAIEYINILTGKRYKKADIKILDMSGHLRDLDELKHLKHSDIICMLAVKNCSQEELNALCDKVSRLDDPIPLAAAFDCMFRYSLAMSHLPSMVSELADDVEKYYKLLPYVTNLDSLGRYVYKNNLWVDGEYKVNRTRINFRRIGQEFWGTGNARRSRYGYVLCYGSLIEKYKYHYMGKH